MIWLRLYLLGGLILHKAVWEYMKRTPAPGSKPARANTGLAMTAVKWIKIMILIGIAVQAFLPDILPISDSAGTIHLTGVVIYTAGLIIALLGRIQLGNNWSDIEAAQVLTRQRVVSHGLYRFIRHPIYVGDILLLAGFELTLNSWLVLGVLAMTPIILWLAVGEEKMLVANLSGYEEYRARTKRFIPFIV